MNRCFCLILSAILIAASNADVDCSKRPDFRNVRTCCKIPEPNWSNFQDQCPDQQIPSSPNQNPCFLECAFNVTNALNGDTLNMVNARTMLSTLYSDNPAFIDAFAKGYATCGPLVSQQISKFKGNRKMPSPNGLNCPLLGTFYHMCAQQKVFLDCPPSAWNPTPTCQSAREFLTSCGPSMRGPGRQRPEGGQNPRGGQNNGQRNGQNGGQRMGRGRRDVEPVQILNLLGSDSDLWK